VRLEGKVAIVSGGGTGIGAATARRFAAEGAKVIVTGRRPEPLEEVAADTVGLAVPGDATDPAHAPAVVAAAVEHFGGVDIVIANAAVGFGGTAGDVADEPWLQTLDVNVTGPMRLVRAALPAMLERGGGSIVLVSSISGMVASTDSAAYITSKHALIGLARSLAVDYGPSGIRANALCPGWVVTAMADESADELAAMRGITREEAYFVGTEHVPLRRPATPEEIAACALFLASDESSFVTGAMLVADGGTTAVDAAALAWDA
jgi:meso-butanediol dehydrogenase/(S,S)-butanediol dehydrogenase/diacetyl reductase